jgi:hypothetical protein
MVSVPVGVVESVLIVSVLVVVFVPSSVTEVGAIEQVIPFDPGAVQLSATVWLNPNFGEILMVEVRTVPVQQTHCLGKQTSRNPDQTPMVQDFLAGKVPGQLLV